MRDASALLLGSISFVLAGCGETPPVAEAPPPPPPPPVVEAPPPPPPPLPVEPTPPALVTASLGEDLWHLRSALNVAALICNPKVYTAIVPSYNRLLTVHKALFATAVQTELDQFKAVDKKKYQSLYDTHMTKLYNQYSLIQERVRFCDKASETVGAAVDMADDALSAQATAMVFRLNLAGDISTPPAASRISLSASAP